jgi:hypothetical protein
MEGKVNKDASEFMLEEYNHITNAYFGLRDQVNDWFKAYLALVALPITLLTAVLKLNQGSPLVSISDLPSLVSGLLVMVAVLGLFVVLSIVAMRMEMILYARTMTGVRRYFGVLDRTCQIPAPLSAVPAIPELTAYLMLPTSDAQPPFFELWRPMFYQVIFIGLIDGTILAVAIHSLLNLAWGWSSVLGLLYGLLHLGVYGLLAWWRRRRWGVPRFPANLQPRGHW